MKTTVGLIFTFLAQASFGVYQIGDTVSNLCWKNDVAEQICLADYPNRVRVLVYNTGWCPDCNSEMSALAPKSTEFANNPVTFLSLSSEGFRKGVQADAEFLKLWKAKHSIPFPVALSPRDVGKLFLEPPIYIPNVAVVDTTGKLAFKEVEPNLDKLFATIRQLIP